MSIREQQKPGGKPVQVQAGLVRLIIQRAVTNLHVWLYRLFGGAITGRYTFLLTTTGRKTGKARTIPLFYLMDGESVVTAASNGGSAWTPTWWLNLKKNPEALAQVGKRVIRVRAEQATPEEKARLWPLLVQMYPPYETYQKHTKREIPVVVLRLINQ